jgi:hypothetical protein
VLAARSGGKQVAGSKRQGEDSWLTWWCAASRRRKRGRAGAAGI